jgi:hypothetical protein
LDITEDLDVSDTIETDAVIFLSISPDKGRHHKLFGRTELKEDRVGGNQSSLDGHTGYIRNRDSIGGIGSISRKHITGRVSEIKLSPSTVLYFIGRCGITISSKGIVNGSVSLIVRSIGIKVSGASPHSAVRLVVRQTEHLIHNVPNIAYNGGIVDSGRDSRALLSKRERSESKITPNNNYGRTGTYNSGGSGNLKITISSPIDRPINIDGLRRDVNLE